LIKFEKFAIYREIAQSRETSDTGERHSDSNIPT